MRFPVNSLRGVVVLAVGTALALAACGGSTAATGTPGSGTATSAATTAATKGTSPTVTANKSLCNLLSASQVSAVVGGTISSVVPTKTTAKDGSTAENCTYLPGGGAHVDAEISYLFSSNGASAYASDKADDTSRGDAETDISGLGDAAFWGIAKPLYANTLQLTVQKGNVLMLMTLGGAGADGSTMVSGAEGLARLALPSL